MENKIKINFIVCPFCNGTGQQGGKVCIKCRGIGVALSLDDKVCYWGKYFDSANILYEKATKKIRMILNIALAVFALSGLILMVYLGYRDDFKMIFDFTYWLRPTGEKLYFWISLLAGLYLYYRLEQESGEKFSVARKIFHRQGTSPGIYDWSEVWRLPKERLVDVSLAFTEECKKAVESSWELAKHFEHPEFHRLHLLAVLTYFDQSAIILGRLGVNFEDFKQKMSRFLAKTIINRGGNPMMSIEMHKTVLAAYAEAYHHNDRKVNLTELVKALATPEKLDLSKDEIQEVLVEFNLNYQKVKNVVAWIKIQKDLREGLQRFRNLARFKPKSGLDRAMTGIATPILNQFSEDLTLKAGYGHLFPCIGREQEMDAIFRILEGSRTGVLLVGPQGVGKTSIVEGLAQRMVTEDVPEILQDKRLVSLDIARLLAGADASVAEERLLVLCDEVIRSGNIVLVVENLHNLSGITTGGESSLDLSEVFAQILTRHQFYCIATSNALDYSKVIEGRSLGASFQTIRIEELELNAAICVLEARSGPIEYQNQVYFSYDAIEKTAILTSRYIHDRYLPEKAIEIMEQAAIKVHQEQGDKKVITADDVAAVIAEKTKIPVTKVTEKESQKLLNLEDKIHERMIEQEEAVKIVAASLRRARAELRDGKRPIASLLFLGPTGVGKTELAKTVAEVYFNNENNMLRFDMSEYQDQQSINRLIGYGSTPGILTEAVRKNPFSLVLFDEVEKAHADILNLFLQVMDDGRLTDVQGRVIDFTNTIVIMTSNAGAQFIQDEINAGKNIEEIKNNLINEQLRQYYRPEFLNRFDGVVVFKPLTMTAVIKIAKLMILKIVKRLEERGIVFEVSDEAIAELAELGFDPKFGARPLRRTIQEKVDDVLANYLLEGKIDRRDKVILEPNGKLSIVKAEQL